MASVDIKDLSKQEHDELCCSYAALLLHDDGQAITVQIPFPNILAFFAIPFI